MTGRRSLYRKKAGSYFSSYCWTRRTKVRPHSSPLVDPCSFQLSSLSSDLVVDTTFISAFQPIKLVWHLMHTHRASSELERMKEMMNHQSTFILPQEVTLRSTFQRSRGIIRKRLAPFLSGTRVRRTSGFPLCAPGTTISIVSPTQPFSCARSTQPISCVPQAHYHFFSVRERTLSFSLTPSVPLSSHSFQSLSYPLLSVAHSSHPLLSVALLSRSFQSLVSSPTLRPLLTVATWSLRAHPTSRGPIAYAPKSNLGVGSYTNSLLNLHCT